MGRGRGNQMTTLTLCRIIHIRVQVYHQTKMKKLFNRIFGFTTFLRISHNYVFWAVQKGTSQFTALINTHADNMHKRVDHAAPKN